MLCYRQHASPALEIEAPKVATMRETWFFLSSGRLIEIAVAAQACGK